MQPLITVRLASESDISQLENLETLSWDTLSAPVLPTPNAFKTRLPLCDTLVAARDNSILGYATLGSRTSLSVNEHVGRLRAIVVDKTCRRQGIAKVLLNNIYKLALERGYKKLTLTAMSSNLPALQFYKNQGFIEEGRLKSEFLINNTYIDDVLLSKWIDLPSEY